MLALEILHTYLTDTAVSPLQRDFVQTEHPICADVFCCTFYSDFLNRIQVHIQQLDQRRCFATLKFGGVDVDRIDEVTVKLRKTFDDIINGVDKIDMDRMHAIIKQRILSGLCFG
jgi:Zn-dependent M16 (insulinase) family peptidase